MLSARCVPRLQHLACVLGSKYKASSPQQQDPGFLGQSHHGRTLCGGASYQPVALKHSPCASLDPRLDPMDPANAESRTKRTSCAPFLCWLRNRCSDWACGGAASTTCAILNLSEECIHTSDKLLP